jgi:hypothetical protein
VDSLSSESVVDGGERVQLVFQRGGILGVKETAEEYMYQSTCKIREPKKTETDTFMTLEPSVWKRIRLPVISVG